MKATDFLWVIGRVAATTLGAMVYIWALGAVEIPKQVADDATAVIALLWLLALIGTKFCTVTHAGGVFTGVSRAAQYVLAIPGWAILAAPVVLPVYLVVVLLGVMGG